MVVRSDHRRDVLVEGSAERDVEDLDAATDGEDGHAALPRFAGEREFELVAPGVGLADRLVGLLSVPPRFDVTSPGEDDAVEAVDEGRHVGFGERGEHHREAACAQDRVRVGVADDLRFELAVGADRHLLLCRDADDRVHRGIVGELSPGPSGSRGDICSQSCLSSGGLMGSGPALPPPEPVPDIVEMRSSAWVR